ncbi:reticulon-3-B-like isoform X1 [Sphaeramia orbicularis]|uniref:reticulon-3-B-like isoform X1 n=1 Tax=Sphaeramia orbicularis TaxID=375764 RepID=UPI00117EEAD4|nr:reticulon-3-B-like isoform X1 [Sphaeramia orbicularis]
MLGQSFVDLNKIYCDHLEDHDPVFGNNVKQELSRDWARTSISPSSCPEVPGESSSRSDFKSAPELHKLKNKNMASSTPDSSSSRNSSSSSLQDLTHLALQLIHWKEPKKSALAFGLSLLVLISMATLSVISVVSYLLLTCLCITITFRVYKSVIQAVQKSNEGHPFKSLLDRDISLSADAVRQIADQVIVHLNQFSFQTRRLLLVEDLVDSLKLAAVMWVMTHVGAVFNGLTILILADIIFFTSPLIYQKKKTQIDQYLNLVQSKMEETLLRLQDRLPGAVKKIKPQ